MERESRLGFVTRGRVLGAAVLAFMAVGFFDAGRDVERTAHPQAKSYNPVTWVAVPIANFVESAGIVNAPHPESSSR
jgi:hypothetical protein